MRLMFLKIILSLLVTTWATIDTGPNGTAVIIFGWIIEGFVILAIVANEAMKFESPAADEATNDETA